MWLWILLILGACTSALAASVRQKAVAMTMLTAGTALGMFAGWELPGGNDPRKGLTYGGCIAVVLGITFLVRKRNSRNG